MATGMLREQCGHFARPGSLPSLLVTDYLAAFDTAAPAYSSLWALPIAWFGGLWTWPTSLLTKAFTMVHLSLGNMWRRFSLRLEAYPLALCQVAHPLVPFEERLESAKSFFNLSPCCIDDDFSLKLRGCVHGPEDLVRDNNSARVFLQQSLEGLVGSTSHVEDGFAHMRRHLQSSWRAPGIASLASRHCLAEHKRVHSRWTKKAGHCHKPAAKQEAKKRPVWAAGKLRGQGANGFHEYVSATYAQAEREVLKAKQRSPVQMHRAVLRQLGCMWRSLSEADRSRSCLCVSVMPEQQLLSLDPSKKVDHITSL